MCDDMKGEILEENKELHELMSKSNIQTTDIIGGDILNHSTKNSSGENILTCSTKISTILKMNESEEESSALKSAEEKLSGQSEASYSANISDEENRKFDGNVCCLYLF